MYIEKHLSSSLLLGVAQNDITPRYPAELVGFYRPNNLSHGTHSPLALQAAVWRLGNFLCCLLAIDHIGFCLEDANILRDKIAGILGISARQVMLCFSHTHSAPNDSTEPEYFRFLCGQAEDAVRQAVSSLSPVKIAWGNAFGDIGVNRRAGAQSLDRRIGILKAVDAYSGEPRLALLRVTAHANTLKADNLLVSSDYFGAAREELSRNFSCPVMLTQGASGNVAPKYFQSQLTPPDADDPTRFVRSESACADMAHEIWDAASPVWEKLRPADTNTLFMDSVSTVFYADVPSETRALEIAEEARRESGIDGTSWLAEVRRLLHQGITFQQCQIEIQYFQLGDGCLCGVPNEIMCEFALRASHLAQDDLFYFGGYTNGCTGYFPTEEEFDLGGYEVYWSWLIYYPYHKLLSPLRRDSCKQLIEAAVRNRPGQVL